MKRLKPDAHDPRFRYSPMGVQTGLNWDAIKRQQATRSVLEDQVRKSIKKKRLVWLPTSTRPRKSKRLSRK